MIKEHEDINIFKLLDPDTRDRMRRLIIEAVLGTDMRFHFDILNELKTKLESTINTNNEEDLHVILSNL